MALSPRVCILAAAVMLAAGCVKDDTDTDTAVTDTDTAYEGARRRGPDQGWRWVQDTDVLDDADMSWEY